MCGCFFSSFFFWEEGWCGWGWGGGEVGSAVISTPPRFGIAFSPSPCLCAVCDVGFGNNKWLDVSGCHVKPGEGHAPLSEHAIAARGGVSGLRGFWGFGAQTSLTPAVWGPLCQPGQCHWLRSSKRFIFMFLCFLFFFCVLAKAGPTSRV